MIRFHGQRRCAFTLTESLISITLVSLAGTSLLLAAQVAFENTINAQEQIIADGMTSFLFDEVAGLPYHDKSETAFDTTLGPETGETTRATFDDLDDFNGLTMYPISDEWGVPLGEGDGSGGSRATELRSSDALIWRAIFTVNYADESDPSIDLPSGTSGMRSMTIKIEKSTNGAWMTISSRRRVFAYVPKP
jgi:type II secretory pathway pseudopilin PulG